MGYVPAAYFKEIERHLYKREYPVPPEFSLRQTKHGLIEVREDLRIKVSWRGRNGKIKTGYWIVRKGMVLSVHHRKLKKWEKAELEKPENEREINVPVETEHGKPLVATLERDKDLYSAARRFLRHIARSLVARRVGFNPVTKKWIDALYKALMELTRSLRPESPGRRKAMVLFSQIIRAISKARKIDSPKEWSALFDAAWEKVAKSRGDNQIIAIGSWFALLAEYPERILAQIVGNAKKGVSIADANEQIDQGVSAAYYKGIPDLIKKLSPYAFGKPITSEQLQRFAQQAKNIARHLERVCGFKPSWDRAYSPQVQRLHKANEYVERHNPLGLYNALNRALAKIEALVLAERPIPEEILEAQKTIPALAE